MLKLCATEYELAKLPHAATSADPVSCSESRTNENTLARILMTCGHAASPTVTLCFMQNYRLADLKAEAREATARREGRAAPIARSHARAGRAISSTYTSRHTCVTRDIKLHRGQSRRSSSLLWDNPKTSWPARAEGLNNSHEKNSIRIRCRLPQHARCVRHVRAARIVLVNVSIFDNRCNRPVERSVAQHCCGNVGRAISVRWQGALQLRLFILRWFQWVVSIEQVAPIHIRCKCNHTAWQPGPAKVLQAHTDWSPAFNSMRAAHTFTRNTEVKEQKRTTTTTTAVQPRLNSFSHSGVARYSHIIVDGSGAGDTPIGAPRRRYRSGKRCRNAPLNGAKSFLQRRYDSCTPHIAVTGCRSKTIMQEIMRGRHTS